MRLQKNARRFGKGVRPLLVPTRLAWETVAVRLRGGWSGRIRDAGASGLATTQSAWEQEDTKSQVFENYLKTAQSSANNPPLPIYRYA